MRVHIAGGRFIPTIAAASLIAASVLVLPVTPASAAGAVSTSCDGQALQEGMQVVQQVKLPTSNWDHTWDYDNSAAIHDFDRIGYCLELTKSGQETQHVYASMQAFTNDATRIGIPTASADLRRQRVSDLYVSSNVAGVANGARGQGYIEMWPTDYDPANSGQVYGASTTTYDADDRPSSTGYYGSFQVHQISSALTGTDAPQTVLAINGWNDSKRTIDIGIGSSTGANPDWTFAGNAKNYSTRTLTVYARPSVVTLSESPEDLRLYPRDSNGKGHVVVSGTASEQVTALSFDSRVEGSTQWGSTPVPVGADRSFTGEVSIPAELKNREFQLVATTSSGEKRVVGHWNGIVAGSVIVIEGQSNAESMGTNSADQAKASTYSSEWVRSYGSPEQNAVLSASEHSWNFAQASVNSIGDKRWNAGHVGLWGMKMGNELVQDTKVPVAVINGAKGGQVIEYFTRNTSDRDDQSTNYGRLYSRMRDAGLLNNVDALFWYQGESDRDRAAEHVEGMGKLFEGWTHDYAKAGDAKNLPYYVFQVRNSCDAQTVGLGLREAQRQLLKTFPQYRIDLRSVTGVPKHDGCHFPFVGGYEDIAQQAAGVVERDLFGGSASGLEAPNPTTVTGSANSRVLEIHLANTTDAITVSGDPSADFVLGGSTATVTNVSSEGGGLLRLTLSKPLGASAATLSYLAHRGTGPTIATSRDVGLLSFASMPITLNPTPKASSTLSALTLDGRGVDGFEPTTTTYESTGSGRAPDVVATPTDRDAQVEVMSSASRVDVRVTASDGVTTSTYTVWLSSTTACPVTSPWMAAGWGGSSASSFCQLGGSSFRIGDGNSGVWTNSDSISTVYQKDSLKVGDAFEVELSSMTSDVNSDSRAGIVVRNDLSQGSGTQPTTGYALLAVSSASGSFMQWDDNGNGWIDRESAKIPSAKAPVYLRVVRQTPTTLVGYERSSVSEEWTAIGIATLTKADEALDVGVFANSNRQSSSKDTGEFRGATLATADHPAVAMSSPVISGSPAPSAVLSASVEILDPTSATVSYEWLRNGTAIPGATGSTYTVTSADSGSGLSVQATAVAAGRTTGSALSDEVRVGDISPTSIGWVSVTGTASLGQKLTASASATPSDAKVSYQWLRDGVAVQDATAADYVVSGADVGHALSVRASASAPGRESSSSTSVIYRVDSLVSGWDFQQGTNNVFPDQTPAGRTATVTGTTVTGPIGKAIELDGSARGVIQGSKLAASLGGASAVSISAWIRPTGLSAEGTNATNWVFGSRIDQKAAGIDINFVGDQLRVAGRSSGADGYSQSLFAYPNDEKWHHIAAELDYVNKTIRLWIDGAEQKRTGGNTIAFGKTSYTPGSPAENDTFAGSPTWDPSTFFTGGIDELRIYASALDGAGIAELATPESPAVTISVDGTPAASGWYTTAPTVKLGLAVPLPSSVSIESKMDDGTWSQTGDSPVVVPEGTHTVQARSSVGQTLGEVSTEEFKVDTIAPEVTSAVVPQELATGSTVTLSASDATSGVERVEYKLDDGEWEAYSAPFVVPVLGDHRLSVRATDVAGNVSVPKQSSFTVSEPTPTPTPTTPTPTPTTPTPTPNTSTPTGTVPGTSPTPSGSTVEPTRSTAGGLARTGATSGILPTAALLLLGAAAMGVWSRKSRRGME